MFKVAPVLLLVACVTVPPAPVPYPMPAVALVDLIDDAEVIDEAEVTALVKTLRGRFRSKIVMVVPESTVENSN